MSRFLKSLKHAFRGISLIFNQRNFKIHLFFTTLVIVFGFWLEISVLEWLCLLILFALVLLAEAFNTGLENTLDCVSREHREDIRDAKDASAGAVLITVIFAIIIGFIIFLPKLIFMYGNI